jgi:GNAT superfamily N-acetyltransferase
VTSYLDIGLLQLQRPERLTLKHDVGGFDSGTPLLDRWLRNGALRNDAEGAVRVYVVCQDTQIVAFYSLANGAVFRSSVASARSRELSASVPVMILGRLAVERRLQGQGLGRSLLRDAVLRTLQAAEVVGIQALLVHAKDEEARAFYERCGFLPSPIDPLTLMLPLKAARSTLSAC